jgi:hypothetical protein
MLRILIKEMISDLKTRRTKLNVFDFDGTLFNSPEPPTDWKKSRGSWYYELKSLSQELIGDGSRFWNRRVVSDALKCLLDDKSITILLTGRNQRNFDEIVKELITSAGLNFDYVKLNPGGNTESFKINEIKKILDSNYRIKTIEFWDDNEEYLQTYKNTFEDLGYNVLINLI